MTPRPPRTDWWRPALRPDESATPVPGWVALCERAFAAAPAPVALVPDAAGRAAAEQCFAPVVAPVVAAADLAPLDGLAADLTAALARTATRTMVAEVHRELRGSGTAADVTALVARVATPDGLRALAARVPLLFRLLATQAARRAAAAREILAHAEADRADLVAGLLGGTDPGPVTRIDAGAGDTHRDGRSVSVVHFADGTRLVHKPRSLAVHVLLAELAGRLDLDLGAGPAVLDRGHHGWSSFVVAAPCDSAAAVGRFHRRAGALLAVMHALRATDLHCENLVAAGEHPVAIDLETVLHPGVLGRETAVDPARWVLDESVLRTALLPRHGSSVAGLGTSAPPVSGGEAVDYVDAGLPTMRLVRRPAPVLPAANRAVLDGVAQSAADHAADVVAGFRDAYDRLVQHRDDLVAGPVGAMAAAPTRVILRNTRTYARLLDECTHPDLLVSADVREAVLRRLAGEGGFGDAVIDSEVEQLWRGDVPVFEARPGTSGVFAVDGDTAVLTAAGPDHRHGLYRLSRSARDRQAWIVAAALGARRTRPLPASSAGTAGTAERVAPLTAATMIADRLLGEAIDDGRRCNWLSVYGPGTSGRVDAGGGAGGAVLPAGTDLGAGHLGIALFLAETARLGGAVRHRRYARRAVVDVAATVLGIDPAHAPLVGPGAAGGLGGIAYGLHRLDALLPEAGLAAAAAAAVALLVRCDGGADLGLAGGRAGGLLALLALAPDVPAAAAALAPWTDALAADAHRAEGATATEVALALARAGRRLDRDDVTTTARALVGDTVGGLGGPGSLDAPDAGHGLLAGLVRTELDPTTFVAQRLRARAVDLAASATDDTLGHGTAGVLDLLVREPGADPAAAARVSAELVRRVQSRTERSALGADVPLPGLADGLAGIGWSLLRLHAAQHGGTGDAGGTVIGTVPAVLTLDTPTVSSRIGSTPRTRTVPTTEGVTL